MWRDFERRSAEYYGLLGQVVDLGRDIAASEGYLPADIVERVNAQRLDTSRLTESLRLRGYQSFGARFALVQRRVILGDEMGLGKTIQAIATMAHLAATGAPIFSWCARPACSSTGPARSHSTRRCRWSRCTAATAPEPRRAGVDAAESR